MKKRLSKSLVSLALAFLFVFSAASGIFPTDTVAKAANIFCNVRFTKPAICCDVGETIDLTKCGVQFTADTTVVTSGISWTNNGAAVTSFKPSAAGTYTLVAKSGSRTKNIYVVAKNPSDTEYVLYFNDFNSAEGIRTIEKTDGSYWGTSGGVLYMDASQGEENAVRVLFPEFLEEFGDMNVSSSVRLTSTVNSSRWGSIITRVQNDNYPYIQGRVHSDISASNGLEIIERTPDNGWYYTTSGSVENVDTYYYFDLSVSVKGTTSKIAINGTDIISFNKTPYETGGVGYEIRGLRFTSQYIKITIDGNETEDKNQRVSFTKPAIRATIGDIIDLTKCDVQLSADSLYTKGSNIVWKQNGNVITKFVPSSSGVTPLTATANGITKNVYIVTKSTQVGEHVLYYNDFSIAPSDIRIVEKVGSTNIYHDGATGTYVVNASGSESNYGRILLPVWLDDFGDVRIEARIKESSPVNNNCWSSITYRVQNGTNPYMQMSSKYNAALSGGVKLSDENNGSSTALGSTQSSFKSAGNYNAVAVLANGNVSKCYINGAEIISSENTPYSVGAMGFQAKGLMINIDYVKVTLGDTSAEEDTVVKCGIAASMPAIGCNAGQKVLLSECDVQMVYGTPTIKGSEITWSYNGKTITEFEAPLGISVLEAKYNDRVLKVWVIGKKTFESEYVIYNNDFSTAQKANEIRVIETTNGGKAYYENGTYVLNASASADTYVRILLPENLSIFGDAEYLTRVKLTNPVDESKWASMMYRVQNSNFPYVQGCLRYNATIGSGIEIASKTSTGAWNVTQSGSYSGLVNNGYNTWMMNPSAKESSYYINGSKLLTDHSTPYSVGDWGLQARGLTLTVDYIKLSFKKNHTKASIYTLPGNYADVRDPETGIRLAPALITEVKTMSDFNNLLNDSPAIAIVTYDASKGIVFSDGSVSLEKATDKMSGTIIPAFRVNDNNSVDSLVSFLEDKNMRDVFVVSTQGALVKRATDAWTHIRGVLDYTGVSLSSKAETLRADAVANGARVVILSDEYCTKDKVTYVQDMFSCVWMTVKGGKTASVSAINMGPYGIVTPDRTVTEACYRDYYAANTMIRRPNSVGHRCVPTMSHENSLSGLKLALSNGATMVEHDIYLAKDGVLMVMHDSTIDRTTNGSGKLEEMTSTQLKQYVINQYSQYATEPIPSLEDFFAYCKEDPRRKLVVEVKTSKTEYATALYNLIQKYQLQEQVVVITFGSTPIYAIRDLLPGMPVSNLTSAVPLDENDPIVSASNLISRAQGFNSVLSVEYYGLGYNTIRECAYRGLTLWPWTVDNRAAFDELWLGNAGGITTNYCHWASNYIANLSVNSAGKVIATNYKGSETDVTSSAEIVIVEDTLGITFTNGKVNVPQTTKGGKASYFFRYKSTTGSGQQYYTVTDVQTVEVVGDGSQSLTLKDSSSLSISEGLLNDVKISSTAKSVMDQFDSPVVIKNLSGNVVADNDKVATGYTVSLASDETQSVTIIISGDVNKDGLISTTDYLQVKSYFLGGATFDAISLKAADYDRNGGIQGTDYVKIKNYFYSSSK